MEDILLELKTELFQEVGEGANSLDALGSSANRLVAVLDAALSEVRGNPRFDPFEMTNRVLLELERYHRLRF